MASERARDGSRAWSIGSSCRARGAAYVRPIRPGGHGDLSSRPARRPGRRALRHRRPTHRPLPHHRGAGPGRDGRGLPRRRPDLRAIGRTRISERTKEGLAAARARGPWLGRPKGSLGPSKLDGKEGEIEMLLGKRVSKASIAKILDVAPSTLHSFIQLQRRDHKETTAGLKDILVPLWIVP
jgi:hypothetical protein